jgi:HTH-type transcriptional regulator / antitoxin MqsA
MTHSCPNGHGEMVRETRSVPLTYKGQTIVADLPGFYCSKCDEGVCEGADLTAYTRAFNRLKARVQGLLAPEEIRRIRKKLNLTQELAGRIIGGGTEAFGKYEAGDILPSTGLDSALRLLDNRPEQLSVLMAERAA